MAQLLDEPFPMPESTWKPGMAIEENEIVKALDALQKRSNELPLGEVVGGLFRWQWGDGYAYYLVVDDDPLTLQWVPFWDNWQVEFPLIKGLDRDDVEGMLRSQRALYRLFSGSS